MPSFTPSLQSLLALSVLFLAAQGAGPAPAVDETSPDEAVYAPVAGRELRVERFVLWRRTGGPTSRPAVAGFVEWRKRETGSGPQMECDARFLRGGEDATNSADVERVLHVERLTDYGPGCVWREIGPGTGRSVQAEWSADGRALDLAEWSAAGKRRGTLVAAGGASMPLYLVELLRQGGLASGRIVRFDPLARTLEPLEVRTVWLEEGGPLAEPEHLSEGDSDRGEATTPDAVGGASPTGPRTAVRTVELVRADGSLAGRYRFRGHDLVGFQWQESDLVARAVSPDEYARLEQLHAPAPAAAR